MTSVEREGRSNRLAALNAAQGIVSELVAIGHYESANVLNAALPVISGGCGADFIAMGIPCDGVFSVCPQCWLATATEAQRLRAISEAVAVVLASTNPCSDGCQYAKDVAMEGHSCAGRCQYEDEEPRFDTLTMNALRNIQAIALGPITSHDAATPNPEQNDGQR